MTSNLIHQSPFSNFEIIILANSPTYTRDVSNDQLFGLLTIANKPILQQLLEQFFRLHFTRIVLVCLEKDQSLYADFLFSYFKMDDPNTKIQLFPVDGTQTTCEIIRKVAATTLSDQFEESKSKPNSHIIVYPIDLITSIRLTDAVDFHIESTAMITIIASRKEQGITNKECETAPGFHFQKNKMPATKGNRLLVYNETNPKQLVELLSDADSIKNDLDLILKSAYSSDSNSTANEEEQKEVNDGIDFEDDQVNDYDYDKDESSSMESEKDIEFTVNSSMKVSGFNLKKFHSLIVDPSITLTNAYLLSPACIRYLFKNKKIHSIESELIPMICSKKNTKKVIKTAIFLTKEKAFAFKVTDYVSFFVANMRCAASNLVGFSPNADLIQIDTKSQKDDLNDIDNEDADDDIENYNNTLKAYYKEDPLTLPEKFKYSPGNVYGSYLIVQSDNVIIQKSVIGRHCKIGKRVKIINSVILDHVTIDEGVELKNCIVGANSVLRKNSSLKQCIVLPGFNADMKLECEKCFVPFGSK